MWLNSRMWINSIANFLVSLSLFALLLTIQPAYASLISIGAPNLIVGGYDASAEYGPDHALAIIEGNTWSNAYAGSRLDLFYPIKQGENVHLTYSLKTEANRSGMNTSKGSPWVSATARIGAYVGSSTSNYVTGDSISSYLSYSSSDHDDKQKLDETLIFDWGWSGEQLHVQLRADVAGESGSSYFYNALAYVDPVVTADGELVFPVDPDPYTTVHQSGGDPFSSNLPPPESPFPSSDPIPLPPAVWLLLSGVGALFGLSRRKRG